MVLVAVLLIIFFQSRSVQLAFLLFISAAIGLYLIQLKKANFRKAFLPVVFSLVSLVLILGSGRLSESSLQSRSSQERVQLWKNTIELIKEKPLLGQGVGNWSIVFPKTGLKDFPRIQERERNFFVQPHCDFLKVWSETGVVGLLLYLAIPFYLLFLCLRRWKDPVANYFFALFSFYLVALFTGRKGNLHLYVLLAVLLVDAFSSVSKTMSEKSSWSLKPLVLLLISPLLVYTVIAQLLKKT